MNTTQSIVLNLAGLISIMITFVIPVIVALVTKLSTPPKVKAIILIFLNAASAFLLQIPADTTGYQWKIALLTFFLGFGVSVASYFGLYKPVGIANGAQKLLIRDKNL